MGKEIQLEEAASNLPEVKVKVVQLHPTFWYPMDFKVCGILQARILQKKKTTGPIQGKCNGQHVLFFIT